MEDWAKEGYDVKIVCLKEGRWIERAERVGIRVEVLNENPEFPNILKIYSFIKRDRPDLVHLWLIQAYVVGIICSKLANIPVIISSIDSVRKDKARLFGLKGWFRFGDILTSRFNTRIIACCEAVKRDYMEWAKIKGDKIEVIYNGVKLDNFNVYKDPNKKREFNLKEGDSVIGVIGRLAVEKDHFTFFRAASIIVRAIPRSRFLIVGEGKLMERLKLFTQKVGISKWVTFTGARDDIPEIISILDVLVLPSLYEGFPNVILEAYACKKPVVATRVGGIPELVVDNHTGILVEPKSPEEMASAIIKILKDKGLQERLGVAGYDRVRRYFTFDKDIQRLKKLYEEVLA